MDERIKIVGNDVYVDGSLFCQFTNIDSDGSYPMAIGPSIRIVRGDDLPWEIRQEGDEREFLTWESAELQGTVSRAFVIGEVQNNG